MKIRNVILRETFFILWIQLLVFGNFSSVEAAKPVGKKDHVVNVRKTIAHKDILAKSQLSYHATGGFTEVNSFAVIITCANGKISTYRSVRNNRHGTFRRTGTLSKEAYLALWDEMLRRRIFETQDAPAPKQDILDEFTLNFEAKVGDASNKFAAYGCSRPEAASYFALRSLMDQTADMKAIWDIHHSIVRK